MTNATIAAVSFTLLMLVHPHAEPRLLSRDREGAFAYLHSFIMRWTRSNGNPTTLL